MIRGPEGIEKHCIHQTNFGGLWILPRGNRLPHTASAARVAALRKALSSRTMNLIVHLPHGNGWGQANLALYSILDAVLSNLQAVSGQEIDVTELVRRIVLSKRNYSENRLTLVGNAKQWISGNEESLTVC